MLQLPHHNVRRPGAWKAALYRDTVAAGAAGSHSSGGDVHASSGLTSHGISRDVGMLFKSLHGLNAKAEHDAVAAAANAADKSSVNGTSTSQQGAVTRNGFSLQTFWPIGRYAVVFRHLSICCISVYDTVSPLFEH
jgi:hypothetical protein